MEKDLSIYNKRVLELVKDSVSQGTYESEIDFLTAIGFNVTNLSKVKKGQYSFTLKQVIRACEICNANANWVFGFEKTKQRQAETDPLRMIRNGLEALENEAKAKKKKR